MDSLIKLMVVLMLCGPGQAKILLTNVQGTNATIYIDLLQRDVTSDLEINFSGYTSNRHFTNVMLYRPRNGHKENISINSNYTGRIEGIVCSNVSFSFLLLNADFKDSGNYTVQESSFETGKTFFLVARRIVQVHSCERITLSFNFPEKTTHSIKIDFATLTYNRTVLLYNITKEDCTSTDILIVEEMEIPKCAFKTGIFTFTLPNISWLNKGSYFAWDENGRLLDSVFIDIDERNKSTTSSPNTQKETGKWLLISALLIALVTVFLVIVAVRNHRTRRVGKTTTNNLTHWTRNQTKSSRNGCQNVKKALISEEIRTVSTIMNSNNHADIKNNKGQANVRMNDKNIYAKGFDCAKSSMRTVCNLQSDSKLVLSETTPGDSVHEYDELNNVCVTDSISKESGLCSNVLGNESAESTANPSSEYDYVVQHTFMTLRPPAPDPIVTMKYKQQTKIEKFLYSFKNVNITPLSRVLPATLYAKLEKRRAKETRCTGSIVELRSLGLTNELSPPCYFELETDLTKKTIVLPKVSKLGERQKKSNSRCISSDIFIYRPSTIQDSKKRTLSRSLSFHYPRNECNDATGMKQGHQRSRSHDALWNDLLTNIKVP